MGPAVDRTDSFDDCGVSCGLFVSSGVFTELDAADLTKDGFVYHGSSPPCEKGNVSKELKGGSEQRRRTMGHTLGGRGILYRVGSFLWA